ncbi:hypothetical protein BX666DRAFT_2100200 [Dichotomocladium elegans]|nr:hypothetical protein BX666DRAFT_2100200 [Dichotomocladium elegans]
MDKIFWWNKHVEAHNKFKQDLRRAKQASWRAFCDSLENDDFSKTVLSKIKRIKTRRERQTGYVNPDGDAAGAIAMRDHLASVYSGSSLPAGRPPDLPSAPLPYDVAILHRPRAVMTAPSLPLISPYHMVWSTPHRLRAMVLVSVLPLCLGR